LLGYASRCGPVRQPAPAALFPELAKASYLRPDIVGQGLDIMVVCAS
jgi:3-isopropylmalate dehydrogenase